MAQDHSDPLKFRHRDGDTQYAYTEMRLTFTDSNTRVPIHRLAFSPDAELGEPGRADFDSSLWSDFRKAVRDVGRATVTTVRGDGKCLMVHDGKIAMENELSDGHVEFSEHLDAIFGIPVTLGRRGPMPEVRPY